MEDTYKLKFEVDGFEDAKEDLELLAEAYDGFPAQVVVKNCHHCTINIVPEQKKIVKEGRK